MKQKPILLLSCILILLFTAKFYLGFYQLHHPPYQAVFIKEGATWKSSFYSPINKDNKSYKELTESEEYEQQMFDRFAYTHMLNDIELTSCGDLLSRFAKKPRHLEYVDCTRFTHSQTIVAANYRVVGSHAIAIENYFIKNHNMPPLKVFRHTGYEPSGFGNIEVDALTRLNPYMSVYIEMGGYARKDPSYDKDANEIYDFTLLEKEQVPYFTVTVSIMVI